MTSKARIKTAVVLFIVSYALGWPALIGIEALAAYYQSTFIASIGPMVYVLSWIPWVVAFIIGGPPALKLAKEYLLRIFSRKKSA